jgi:hypothetical protein
MESPKANERGCMQTEESLEVKLAKRMTALARASSNCRRQTRPIVRKGASHQQTHNCLTVTKIWSWAPDGGLTPRQAGRLIVSRNIILTVI